MCLEKAKRDKNHEEVRKRKKKSMGVRLIKKNSKWWSLFALLIRHKRQNMRNSNHKVELSDRPVILEKKRKKH